jgi:hypothetical protein
MKRLRVSTLMLIIVIVACGVTVVMQRRQLTALRKETDMKGMVIEDLTRKIRGYSGMLAELEDRLRRADVAEQSKKVGR